MCLRGDRLLPPSVQWKGGRVKILESCILTDGGVCFIVRNKSSAELFSVSSVAFGFGKNPSEGWVAVEERGLLYERQRK